MSGRRVTGIVTELPLGIKAALGITISAAAVVFGAWGMWTLFNAYYFKSQSLFILRDVRSNVTISTGKTLTPDLICEVLGLREGINLFSIPIERKRRELLEQAPNIRDISIVRGMPDKLNITIIEREPIARVGSNGRVVDEEGMVFIRYAGTSGMPEIKGPAEFAQIKPGERLHGNEMAAVKLIHNTMRPDCQLRLQEVNTTNDDYLALTFSDSREATFAWEGMDDEQKDSTRKMQRQLDNLASAMNSDIGRPRKKWNALLPDRIFAAPLSKQ